MTVLDAYPWCDEAFDDFREESGGVYCSASCPLGNHRSARLRFWLGRDGRLILRCMAGCNTLEILRAVGMSFKNCFANELIPENVKHEQVATYQYRDESGAVLYEVVRFEPGWRGRDKDLRPRHREPTTGAWVWGLPPHIRRVLYRLPELIHADPCRVVVVVAGEKDVETLRSLDVLATTNVFGERAEWLADYSRSLASRSVAVIPDDDSAGGRHADEVVGSLVRWGARDIRVVDLPAKDVTAFVNGLRVQGVTDRNELRRELWDAIQAGGAKWRPESAFAYHAVGTRYTDGAALASA